MPQIQMFTFNAMFQENTYVVYDESKECIIIDPGCYESDEQQTLAAFISSQNLQVKYLLNTHCHIDHVLGNDFVKETYRVPLKLHRTELPVYQAVKTYADVYGFPGYREAPVDGYIEEGEQIRFGNTELKTLFLPGHAPGHIAFYHEEEKCCIAGDVLFAGSVGRTDLPGGDFDTLIKSIREKLFLLPDDTVIYPGHGPVTTIGQEKATNPFCGVKA